MSSLEKLIAGMTVAQLADMAGMSVGSLAELVLQRGADSGGRTSPRKAAPRSASRRRRASSRRRATSAHNTRTQAGRAALDEAILKFLGKQKEPVAALDIRQAVGGTATQIRSRVNALIGDGTVSYKGRARGTRYWLTA